MVWRDPSDLTKMGSPHVMLVQQAQRGRLVEAQVFEKVVGSTLLHPPHNPAEIVEATEHPIAAAEVGDGLLIVNVYAQELITEGFRGPCRVLQTVRVVILERVVWSKRGEGQKGCPFEHNISGFPPTCLDLDR
jgi:hypothetical protein